MLDVIVDGVINSLDDGTLCFYLNDDGLGMAPIHRLKSRGPNQHGDTDMGYRLDPRVFQLFLEIQGNTLPDLFLRRHNLLGLLKPSDTVMKFRWTIGSNIRQIEAFCEGGLLMPSTERQGFTQKVAIILNAADPTFYDPSGKNLTFTLGGGSGTFAVPTPVPTSVGASTIDQTASITYLGDWETNPVLIRISGPITNAIITNNTTGEKFDFTGVTIAAGKYYDIDPRWAHKTIVDETGANKIADLTLDSDLSTWHLAPDPEAPGGINSIRVQGSGVTTATQVDMSWFERFIGI